MSNQSEQAARNNAIWCDTVCRAHQIPGEFDDWLWLNRNHVPRFYSNAVTLKRDGVAEQLAAIQTLSGVLDVFSVKDSFSTLDLTPLGFRLLFEAMWLWREADRPLPDHAPDGVEWMVIREPSELAKWEAAWNGPTGDDPATEPDRVFLPSLLEDEDVVFIGAYRDREIVAGAIANLTDEVVGLSNVFTPKDDALAYWGGCVAAIMAAFPGRPLVGYEWEEELAIAQQVGFEPLEPLRIWLK